MLINLLNISILGCINTKDYENSKLISEILYKILPKNRKLILSFEILANSNILD